MTSFEKVFCMKKIRSWLFKKYLQGKKSRARFCLSLGWLPISEKKITENCNSVGAEAHKVGKIVFGPTLTVILPIFGERKKG